MSKIAYRPEIDGLRALAVLPIVLFHFGAKWIPGGFVGVDVFFVISGFLITSIIFDEMEHGRFSIAEFYRRRAIRILPALFVLILVLCAFSMVVLNATEIRDFAESILSLATFMSNFFFWGRTNYFEPDAQTQLLLHTWSLGVEEQFYIVYPLALLAMTRWARAFTIPAVAIAALASFALNLFLVGDGHQRSAFYMFPPRAWELLLGALIALGAVPTLRGRLFREALVVLGLGLIACTLFTLNESAPFPGWNAVTPCIGTAFVIAYSQGTRAGSLLTGAAVRAVGKWSYSLYLWHWPVAVIARHAVGDQFGLATMAACLIISLGLAYLSYRYVEAPFRAPRWSKFATSRLLMATIASLAFIGGLQPLMWSASGWSWVGRTAAARRAVDYLGYNDRKTSMAAVQMHQCFLTETSPASATIEADGCLTQQPGKFNVLIFGDSHAAYLSPGLRAVFPQVHFLQATAAGCKPLVDYPGRSFCRRTIADVYKAVARHRYDDVILAARWDHSDLPLLIQSIGVLAAAGQKVVVIGPATEYSEALPSILARTKTFGGADALERYRRHERIDVDSAMQAGLRGQPVQYVSQQTAICSANSCEKSTKEGTPIEFDYAHLTIEGAKEVARGIHRQHPDLFRIPEWFMASQPDQAASASVQSSQVP